MVFYQPYLCGLLVCCVFCASTQQYSLNLSIRKERFKSSSSTISVFCAVYLAVKKELGKKTEILTDWY